TRSTSAAGTAITRFCALTWSRFSTRSWARPRRRPPTAAAASCSKRTALSRKRSRPTAGPRTGHRWTGSCARREATCWRVPAPGGDWAALLRRAGAHDPIATRQAAAHLPEATGRLASGVGLLLAGRPVEAREALVEATEAADASAPLSAAAALVRGIAALM